MEELCEHFYMLNVANNMPVLDIKSNVLFNACAGYMITIRLRSYEKPCVVLLLSLKFSVF